MDSINRKFFIFYFAAAFSGKILCLLFIFVNYWQFFQIMAQFLTALNNEQMMPNVDIVSFQRT